MPVVSSLHCALETVQTAQPNRQLVPTDAGLVYHPSLALQASFGWQAKRANKQAKEVSSEAHRAKEDDSIFVYVLRSLSDPDRYSTGVTSNVRARLAAHNAGECVHTARNHPWVVNVEPDAEARLLVVVTVYEVSA
jgi:hypothetical protein